MSSSAQYSMHSDRNGRNHTKSVRSNRINRHDTNHLDDGVVRKVTSLFHDYAESSNDECACKPWQDELCARCSRMTPLENLLDGLEKASFASLDTLFRVFLKYCVPLMEKSGQMERFTCFFTALVNMSDPLVWVPSVQSHAHVEAYHSLMCKLMDVLGSPLVKPMVEKAVNQLALVRGNGNDGSNDINHFNNDDNTINSEQVSPHYYTKEELNGRYNNALNLIRKIAIQMPQWKNLVGSCLVTRFTIETMSINQCVAYLKNLFRITTYSADFQQMILNLVVERLMNLDSKLKLNVEVTDKWEDAVAPSPGSPLSVSPSPQSIGNYLPTAKAHIDDFILTSEAETEMDEQGKIVYLAEKLDRCMKIVFDYLNRCSNLDNSQQVMRHIFSNFIDIFNRSILRTYELNSTQFIMFYICSFDNRFGQHFIDFLFSKIFDNNMYPEARRVSIAYAGSFLARAKFLQQDVVLKSMEKLVKWMKTYTESYNHTVSSIDVEHHAVFYHIAQCFFYVLCYHIDSLQEGANPDFHSGMDQMSLSTMSPPSEHNLIIHPFLRQIQPAVKEIVMSSFNPLRVIPKDVTQQIVRALLYYKISDFTSVVRKNLTLPVRNKRKSKFLNKAYFPFDPYVLRESRSYIEPIYCQWNSPTYNFSRDMEYQLQMLLSNNSDPSTHINIVSRDSDVLHTPTRSSSSMPRPFFPSDRRQEAIVGSFDEPTFSDDDDASSSDMSDDYMDDTSDDDNLDDENDMNVFAQPADGILSPSF